MKDNILFWFNHPPKVGKGAFNYVANNWHGKVYYIFLNDFREERKKANWNDGDFGNAQIIKLYENSSPNDLIKNVLSENENAIHIINGLDSPVTRVALPLLKEQHNKRILFMSERPVTMGGVFERWIRNLYFNYKYSLLCKKLAPVSSGMLALGGLGVSLFTNYGFPANRIFQFMYCPPLKMLKSQWSSSLTEIVKNNRPIRLLYIGRFYYKTKGVDVLIKSTKRLRGNYLIDFVGGYGKDAVKVRRIIDKSSILNYLGTWPADEVGTRMQDYDAVVIPTRYDGWNLLVNEAVNAGVPIVVTDGAVSDEIVSNFDCGIVVKNSSVNALAKGLQTLIDHPNLLQKFHENSRTARKFINEDVVGKYLIDIIKYSIYNIGERPDCPWQK